MPLVLRIRRYRGLCQAMAEVFLLDRQGENVTALLSGFMPADRAEWLAKRLRCGVHDQEREQSAEPAEPQPAQETPRTASGRPPSPPGYQPLSEQL